MNKAYEFRLKPNKEQKVFFSKTFGCCRKYWNENIALYNLKVEEGKKEPWLAIYPAKLKEKFPFLKEVDSLALANEQLRLNKAIKDYKKGLKGKPKFHSKNKDEDSYTTNNIRGSIRLEGKYIKLPKVGMVRIVKHREVEGIIKNITVKYKNNHYYISIVTDIEKEPIKKVNPKTIIGFDYSSPLSWIDSEGYNPDNRFYRKNINKVKKNDTKLSRKKLHSQNWKKQLKKNNKLHEKIKNQRKDLLHKESKKYVDNYDILVFEDLDLKGISKALKLGKSTLDNGFGMFRTFVKYKAENQGKYFFKVNKNNTTQTCSNCGNIKIKEEKIKLGIKTYICKHCGVSLDRDINAAINIRNRGWDYLYSLLNNESRDLCSQEALSFR